MDEDETSLMDEYDASLAARIFEQLCYAENCIPDLEAQHPEVDFLGIRLLLVQCKSAVQTGQRDKAIVVMEDIEEQCSSLGVSALRLLNPEMRQKNET